MRSAPTGRPGQGGSEPAAPSARRWRSPRARPTVALGAALLLVIVALGGCSTGSARDARVGATRAAEDEIVLPAAQATYSVREFRPGTPDASPTAAPRPTLTTIAVTTAVAQDGSPIGIFNALPANAGTMYVAVLIANLSAGQTVMAILENVAEKPKDRKTFGYAEATVSGSGVEQWLALQLPLDGSIPPGKYAVYVSLNGEDYPFGNSIAVEITANGSAPRKIGD